MAMTWTMVGVIALLWVFGYLLGVLSLPVGIIIWTVILVFCLRGPVAFFERHHINRTLGTALAYVLLFVLLGLVVLAASSPLFGVGDQFSNLAESIPTYVSGISEWVNRMYATYPDVFQNPTVQQWINDTAASVVSWFSSSAKDSASGIVEIGNSVINSFMVIGFALVVAFWILMDLPALGREVKRLTPPSRQADADFLHTTFTRVMGGYIKGTLLQCAIIGAGCAIAFTALGVPNGVAIGIIAGLMNIIPVVGPWIGGILAALAALLVSPLVALLAVVITVVIQQVVYTFISPKIMQESVDVHPALNIVALMVGSAVGYQMSGLVGSLVGMLASVPAASVLKSVFVYYFEKRTGRRVVAEDGVFFKGVPAEGDVVDPGRDATSPIPVIRTGKIGLHRPIGKTNEVTVDGPTRQADVGGKHTGQNGNDVR